MKDLFDDFDLDIQKAPMSGYAQNQASGFGCTFTLVLCPPTMAANCTVTGGVHTCQQTCTHSVGCDGEGSYIFDCNLPKPSMDVC